MAEGGLTIASLRAELTSTAASLVSQRDAATQWGADELKKANKAAAADIVALESMFKEREGELTTTLRKLEGDLADSAMRESDMRKELRKVQTQTADAQEKAQADKSAESGAQTSLLTAITKSLIAELRGVEATLSSLDATTAARIAALEGERDALLTLLESSKRLAAGSASEAESGLLAARQAIEELKKEEKVPVSVFQLAMLEAERAAEDDVRNLRLVHEERLWQRWVTEKSLAVDISGLERVSARLLTRAEVSEDLQAEESAGRTRAEIALEEALGELGELTGQLEGIEMKFRERGDFCMQTEGALNVSMSMESIESPLGSTPVLEQDILDEKVSRIEVLNAYC